MDWLIGWIIGGWFSWVGLQLFEQGLWLLVDVLVGYISFKGIDVMHEQLNDWLGLADWKREESMSDIDLN